MCYVQILYMKQFKFFYTYLKLKPHYYKICIDLFRFQKMRVHCIHCTYPINIAPKYIETTECK